MATADSNGGGGAGGQYTHGMDVAKVQDIVERLVKAKSELTEAQNAADAAVRKLGPQNWGGPDAEHFRGQWPKHLGHLEASIRDLQQMVKNARADIKEQEAVSSAK
jgi:hypothetical protein